MLHIRQENRFKKKMKSMAFSLFNRLENNNDANFETNGEKRFMDDLFDDDSQTVTVFDVGGNIGNYSEVIINKCNAKKRNYYLHIFEPSKKAFKTLEQKFSALPNIYLNNFGVSDSNRKTDIFFDEAGSSFTSLYQRKDSSGRFILEKKEVINLKRLDDYIRENSIKKIDFLKLDIEGHELSAMNGLGEYLTPNFTKVIQFEYGGTNMDSKTTLRELYFLLESRGYIVFKIMKRHIERRKYEARLENFQYCNYVALAEELICD